LDAPGGRAARTETTEEADLRSVPERLTSGPCTYGKPETNGGRVHAKVIQPNGHELARFDSADLRLRPVQACGQPTLTQASPNASLAKVITDLGERPPAGTSGICIGRSPVSHAPEAPTRWSPGRYRELIRPVDQSANFGPAQVRIGSIRR
jgi:hypothetical protein